MKKKCVYVSEFYSHLFPVAVVLAVYPFLLVTAQLEEADVLLRPPHIFRINPDYVIHEHPLVFTECEMLHTASGFFICFTSFLYVFAIKSMQKHSIS